MIDLYAELLVNNDLLKMLSQRGRNRVIKESLKYGLNYWHKEILPKHFRLGNIAMYPDSFVAKKKGGIPLVQSGNFRDRVLGFPQIRATGKSASIRYQLGRPNPAYSQVSTFYNEYNKDIKAMDTKTKRIIFNSMRGKKITFEEARRQLIAKFFKRTGYPNYLKKRMARGIKAFNDTDRQLVYTKIQTFVLSNYKTLGKANVKVKKNV